MERPVICPPPCGKIFKTTSPRARYCSSTCRSRASRAGTSSPNVISLPVAAAAPAGQAEQSDEPLLVATTRRELDDAGKLDTALGQQALLLAMRMCEPFASAAAVASLAKRHSDLIAQLVPPAPGKPDEIDELTARRLQKAANA